MKKVEIEIPDGKCVKWINGVLTIVDEDVIERIKTFEDACMELGENHQYVRAYREWMRISYAECEDITAYMKLRIITTALNEGWEPTFDEIRWYPWFTNKYSSLVCASLGSAGSYSSAYYGVRLAFKSKELAEYAGRQFLDIYKDFCFKTLTKSNEQDIKATSKL